MDVLDTKRVKTRVDHVCGGCRRTIARGAVNTSVAKIADAGIVYSSYVCPVCEAFMAQSDDDWREEWFEGDVRDSDPDGWEKLRASMEALDPEGATPC